MPTPSRVTATDIVFITHSNNTFGSCDDCNHFLSIF
jgi:hypothetical protein